MNSRPTSFSSAFLASAVLACLVAYPAQAQTIIGGSIGNGDFQAGGGGNPAGDPQTYEQTVNWFHGNNTGPNETINFTNSSQMGGSTDPAHLTDQDRRGGMPFQNRWQFNDTAYVIQAEGEVFSLSYDFGAGGPANRWNGAETMRTFLFTSTTGVTADTIDNDITELGGDDYLINRANDTNPEGDEQWTTRSVPNFYTSTLADVGQTVYFGMRFLDESNGDGLLFPRIDLINLAVGDGSTPGDQDGDLDVDGTDFLIYQRDDGSAQGLMDFQDNYGTEAPSIASVPEPSSLALLILIGTSCTACRWRNSQ
ncbi:MAG: PEP-CTERM sorting domain-containing protein [Lacipirellulaceae bacterium]